MKHIEKIIRSYENWVVIEYEYLNQNSIYIRSIKSSCSKMGNGTELLKDFLSEFKEYDIYLYATDEHGTDLEVLNKWYKKLGFDTCDKVINNLCTTHLRKGGKN